MQDPVTRDLVWQVSKKLVQCGRRYQFFLSIFFATATTWSGSKPKCFCNSLRGAEAPNVFMQTSCPPRPTYRSQPKLEACSSATRAVTCGGNTLSWYP